MRLQSVQLNTNVASLRIFEMSRASKLSKMRVFTSSTLSFDITVLGSHNRSNTALTYCVLGQASSQCTRLNALTGMMLAKIKGSDKSSGNEDGLAITQGTSLSSIPSLTFTGSLCEAKGVTIASKRTFNVAFVMILVVPSGI